MDPGTHLEMPHLSLGPAIGSALQMLHLESKEGSTLWESSHENLVNEKSSKYILAQRASLYKLLEQLLQKNNVKILTKNQLV